jgi:hypothetical protein
MLVSSMEGAQRTEIEDDYSFSAKPSCAALPRKRPELDIPSVSTGIEIAHPPPLPLRQELRWQQAKRTTLDRVINWKDRLETQQVIEAQKLGGTSTGHAPLAMTPGWH